MKKLINLLLLIILIISCNNSNTVEISIDEYNKLKGINNDTAIYPKSIKFIYQGRIENFQIIKVGRHEILAGCYNGYIDAFTMCHYPDCAFCLSDTTNNNKHKNQ